MLWQALHRQPKTTERAYRGLGIRAGSAHVGQLLGLDTVDLEIVVTRVLADDHAWVHLGTCGGAIEVRVRHAESRKERARALGKGQGGDDGEKEGELRRCDRSRPRLFILPGDRKKQTKKIFCGHLGG